MPAVARANGTDSVFSRTGTGRGCRAPITTSTGSGSPTVFVGGIPVVIRGNTVALHPAQGCGPDLSTLTASSSTVFANGQGIGRIGDEYTSDNVITSGSPTVFAGG
jgi:uncharacterized Zn-binding protein involved in type VI secretion